jgi:hypothetical protein
LRELDSRWGAGNALFVLGCVALAEGAYARAGQTFQESILFLEETDRWEERGCALATLGIAARGLGDLPQARRYLYEALRAATAVEAPMPLMYGLPAIALLLTDCGEVERAVELYALASRYPFSANSCWVEDVAGRHVTAAAAALPPETVIAAQERGQAKDLWATVGELLTELEE